MINKFTKNNRGGFTLIETMVAVFILSISITSLMSVVSSSLFAARYARDEMTANYLLQEVVDYIRNDRDTHFLKSGSNPSGAWIGFVNGYSSCNSASSGCYINVIEGQGGSKFCTSGDCTTLYFNATPTISTESYYTHGDTSFPKSKFKRQVLVTTIGDEVSVRVIVTWKNGGLDKTRELKTSLLKWQY